MTDIEDRDFLRDYGDKDSNTSDKDNNKDANDSEQDVDCMGSLGDSFF